MEKITSAREMMKVAQRLRAEGKSIGFVPTMGFLHEGHLSLVDAAKLQCKVVVLSVFVNPTQFGANEDLDRYPQNLPRDEALSAERGVGYFFCPQAAEIYPAGFSTYVEETTLSTDLCGASRPGHFRGVCTVLSILLNIVRPHHMYLGWKDAQQVMVVHKMVKDLFFDCEVMGVPTKREEDGLAMSSRNAQLNISERKNAQVISQALFAAADLFKAGHRDTSRLSGEIHHVLSQQLGVRVIYISIVDRETLQPLKVVEEGKTLIAVAAWVGQTRLIDNILL